MLDLAIEWLPMISIMLVAGAIAGVTTGLFGVGGGFIIVPTLLGIFPLFTEESSNLVYVAIGTSLASIIVSSARAVQAHNKRGLVDFEMLRQWAPWLVVGVLGGLAIASVVDGHSLLLVFAVGVFVYSFYFLFPEAFTLRSEPYQIPTGLGRAALASGLGGFSALLGIGGGTPIVVTMVVCGRTVHQAVATAAGVGFIIAIPGTIGFLLLGLGESALPTGSIGYINLPALLAIAIMSLFTAPLGAKWASALKELHLKRAFGVYLIVISFVMFDKAII